MSDFVSRLSLEIAKAVEQAEVQCEQIRDKDVLLLVGCTGAGKSTSAVYILGGSFKVDDFSRKLLLLGETDALGRFVMSHGHSSETRGLNAAEIPGRGVHLCDLAGFGDTKGFVKDVCACIVRATALQKARSVRIALVMGMSNLDIQNERGKQAVRDIVAVAGMFREVSAHLRSIGLVLADKGCSANGGSALRTLGTATEALKGLDSAAVVVEDYTFWEAKADAEAKTDSELEWEEVGGGMHITRAGQVLLQHFARGVRTVEEMHGKGEIREGDDFLLQELLCKKIPVWPLNVQRADQRKAFQDFLVSLAPVPNPFQHMQCELPEQERNKLETKIMEAFQNLVTRVIVGEQWVGDHGQRCQVVNFLVLTNALKDLKLFATLPNDGLCSAGRQSKAVCDKLCEVNKAAVQRGRALAGTGNFYNLSDVVLAVDGMDDFRKQLEEAPKLAGKADLQGWTPGGLFRKEAAQAIATAFEEQLPAGDMPRLDAERSRKIEGLLACAELLGPPGVEVAMQCADRLATYVQELQHTARACEDPGSVTEALACLTELKRHCEAVWKRLEKSPHQLFKDGGLAAALAAAKEGVISELEELSKRAIEERRQREFQGDGESPSWKLLRLLCNSTELQRHLEDSLGAEQDLTQKFLFDPFSRAFAPTQDAVDVLVENMRDPHYQWKLWYVDLKELAQKIQGLGELGRRVVDTSRISFDELLQEIRCQAMESRNAVVCFAQLVNQRPGRPVSDDSRTVWSGRFFDEEYEEVSRQRVQQEELEKVQKALERLAKLTVADGFLSVAPPGTQVNVGIMLLAACDQLAETLTGQLRRAKDFQDGEGGAFCAADQAPLRDFLVLKALLTLAKRAYEWLECVHTGQQMAEMLKTTVKEASDLIRTFLMQQIAEWEESSVEQSGWTRRISRHLQSAKRLQPLDPALVSAARAKLDKKVGDWRDSCRSAADRAKTDSDWASFNRHAILGGLAFESSELMEGYPEGEFCCMVTEVVNHWTAPAGSSAALSGGDLDPQVGERLTALLDALLRLPPEARREQSNVSHLIERVKGALAPYHSEADKLEKQFRAELERLSFWEATQTAQDVGDQARQTRLLRDLQRGMRRRADLLADQLDTANAGAVKVEDIGSAKRLVSELDKILRKAPDVGTLREEARSCRDSVDQRLRDLKLWAELAGQQSLSGRCDAQLPLSICVAITGDPAASVAQSMIDRFTASQRDDFSTMDPGHLGKLMDWLKVHDQIRLQLPQEFKSNIYAWEELTAFVVDKLKAGIRTADLQKALDEKKWSQAKQLHASFRDTIDEIRNITFIRSRIREFADVKQTLMVLGGNKAVQRAQNEVPKGNFKSAIWAIVTGTRDEAVKTVSLVLDEVRNNLSLCAGGGLSVSDKVLRLRAFQEEVGNDPPDFLESISRQVAEALAKELPKIEASARQEAGRMQTAAAQEDLAGLAEALQGYQTFQGCDGDSAGKVVETMKTFWRNVQSLTNKVLGDVDPTLNLAALGADLMPLRLWLQRFEQLRDAPRDLLLHSLRDFAGQPALAGPLQWWAGLLKPAMDALAQRAEQLTEDRHFKGLAECFEGSRLLGELLGQPPLQLPSAVDGVRKARDEALKALLPAEPQWSAFKDAYRPLLAAAADFPTLPGGRPREACDEVKRKLREKVFTEQHGNKLQAAKTLPDAMAVIVDLRIIGDHVPELLDMVNQHLSEALKQLQNNPAFNTVQAINDLGGLLNQHRLGQMVCAEQSQVFGVASQIAANGVLRECEEKHKETFIHQLTERTGLGHDENRELRGALYRFEEDFSRLKAKLLQQKDLTFQQALALARQELDEAARQCDRSPTSGLRLLTTIIACYSVVKCGEAFIGKSPKEQEERFFRPHVGQVLALLRLLQVHKQGARSGWQQFVDMLGGVGQSLGVISQRKLEMNHMVQMQTGEGKCLTLGLLATFLALTGTACDIVCYQRLLVEQDREFMRPFYVFAGVEDKIRYMTFDELCEERLAVLQDATAKMLESGQSPARKEVLDVSKRALLIDEVDVFFSEKFYGEIYNGAFKVMGPEAEALIRFVWEEKVTHGRSVTNVTQTHQFRALSQRYRHPQLQEALACAAESLATNVMDFNTPCAVPDFEEGRIGYHGADEVDYGLAYENKTVFVYLYYLGEGKFREYQVQPHLGLDLVCGRFSFAEIPSSYCCILGVTGTLSQLMGQDVVKKVAHPAFTHPVKQILWDEYKIRHFTELPSIYGQRDANLHFKLEDHAYVLDNEQVWAEKVDGVIQEQRTRHSNDKVQNAVLVFFETAKDFEKLRNFRNYEQLTEDLALDARQNRIKAATTSGRVTLLTRAFGRGIDFAMPSTHEVVVVQTFLSPLKSEEVQIMGRTARKGKTGRYFQVLCAEHLQSMFGFTDEDLTQIKVSGVQMARILTERQAQTSERTVRAMIARRQAAGDLESETRKWEDLLFDPSKPLESKLLRLAAWNLEHFKQVHYTLILDCSGSMSGRRWQDLVAAFRAFICALKSNEAEGIAKGTAKVSVVFFATHATVMTPHHVRPAEVQDIANQPFSGGTNFDHAFARCLEVVRESTGATREVILFLTDGQGNCVPTAEIQKLLQDHGSRIETFTCIGFGVSNTTQLDQIRALFAAHVGITADPVKSPGNEADLVQTFKDAAVSRGVRHGQQANRTRG